MNIVVRIPDELASRLGASDTELGRQALEAFVIENYRAGRMDVVELRDALGFSVLDEVDAFLKARGVYGPSTVDEIERQTERLASLGS